MKNEKQIMRESRLAIPHNKKIIVQAYRMDIAASVVTETIQRFEVLLPDIPYIGGGENILLGGDALAVTMDISNESQCKVLIDKTTTTFSKLDMLINNAGMTASALFAEFPDLHLFKQTVEVNFYGAVYFTYYALPHLKMTQGRIVAVSSAGGKAAIPYNTAYCASKSALHRLYVSLRMELSQHHVSCTVVCPGWVATEFHESQLNKDGVPRGVRGRAYYTQKTMTADKYAEIGLNAACKRRREVLLGPGALATWLKVIAPGFLDWFAVNVFWAAAIRRAKAGKIEVYM